MATQPKAQDPTAAALSAIEEALNLAQSAESVRQDPVLEVSKPLQPPRVSEPSDGERIARRTREETRGKEKSNEQAAAATSATAEPTRPSTSRMPSSA